MISASAGISLRVGAKNCEYRLERVAILVDHLLDFFNKYPGQI